MNKNYVNTYNTNITEDNDVPNEKNEENNFNIMRMRNNFRNNNYISEKNFNLNTNRYKKILDNSFIIRKNQKAEYNIFNIMNNIFFINKEQKIFKFAKIKDQYKEQLDRLYKENLIQTSEYCKLFIKNNVLPILKKNRYNSSLEIIKDNISIVLKTVGINENYFIEYYNPQNIVEKKYDRNKSIEAKINFRKKFGIGEDVIIDKELERRLQDNELNIDQTFHAMYG